MLNIHFYKISVFFLNFLNDRVECTLVIFNERFWGVKLNHLSEAKH
jgi:hypothetical protein